MTAEGHANFEVNPFGRYRNSEQSEFVHHSHRVQGE